MKSNTIPDQTAIVSGCFSSRIRLASAFFVIAMGSAFAGAATAAGPQLSVSGLATDALVAPLGISDLTPKLSWMDTASVNRAVQAGYQVQAATSAANLAAGQLLWDSGQVQSSAQNAQYAGKALASRSAVTWQVRVWDGTGAVSAWSAPATFRIGLTQPGDWTAGWITSPSWTSTSSAAAMPLFAKQFATDSGISSAMLYVSGIGIVVPSINGVNVGSAVLGPGESNLAAHLAYSTFDVTSMLTAGSANVLGLALGLGNRFVQGDSAAQGYRYVSGGGETTTANGLPERSRSSRSPTPTGPRPRSGPTARGRPRSARRRFQPGGAARPTTPGWRCRAGINPAREAPPGQMRWSPRHRLPQRSWPGG